MMSQQVPRLTWRDESRRGGPLHIARHHNHLAGTIDPHRHEFAEVFWLETGQLVHTANGEPRELAVGHLVCLRPDDVHHGLVVGDGPATWINVSFPVEPLAGLAERYGPDWPWAAEGPVRIAAVGSEALDRLHQWTAVLASPHPRRLDLECFLLEIARLVAGAPELPAADGLPAWLREALPVFTDERHLAAGVPGLARLTGRTMAHLNRVIRAAQGRRATDLVNELRLDWAANQLRLSDRPIAAIAAAVGLANLGHFYRRFQHRFGTTPHRYRVTAWGTAPNHAIPRR